jgi:anti-sigma factor ChrR (cupin superfamily)
MNTSRLNADFDQRVVVSPVTAASWSPSPEPGVHRHRLDRIGDEVARATSIVRYDAGSQFARHTHGGGEEFLVLEGTFSDEHGDYPAGSYVRNPPGSAHTPFSREGCTLFVKLWQFAEHDSEPVRIDTTRAPWRPGWCRVCRCCPCTSSTAHRHHPGRVAPGPGAGLSVLPLHEFDGVQHGPGALGAGHRFNTHSHPGGEEILVLQGLFRDEQGEYPTGTWLRSPRWSRHTPFTGPEGALIYVKVGHLGARFLTPPLFSA